MGKIVVSENISLDGVVQDPTGEEGSTYGSWFPLISEQDREAWSKHLFDEALSAEALLLGRRSDEWFAGPWTSRTGPWADRLNSLPKYVVSSTLDAPKWTNAKLVTGDVAAEIATLKQQLAGDIVVYASSQLVHTLMEHDLVDELRLMVYPVVLGTGARLFTETSASRPMRLTTIATLGDGLAYLTYERASCVLPSPTDVWATGFGAGRLRRRGRGPGRARSSQHHAREAGRVVVAAPCDAGSGGRAGHRVQVRGRIAGQGDRRLGGCPGGPGLRDQQPLADRLGVGIAADRDARGRRRARHRRQAHEGIAGRGRRDGRRGPCPRGPGPRNQQRSG